MSAWAAGARRARCADVKQLWRLSISYQASHVSALSRSAFPGYTSVPLLSYLWMGKRNLEITNFFIKKCCSRMRFLCAEDQRNVTTKIKVKWLHAAVLKPEFQPFCRLLLKQNFNIWTLEEWCRYGYFSAIVCLKHTLLYGLFDCMRHGPRDWHNKPTFTMFAFYNIKEKCSFSHRLILVYFYDTGGVGHIAYRCLLYCLSGLE